jgi:hypothetical protein
LPTSLVVLTQELPLHAVSPALQAKEQALFRHAGCALATVVLQTWPQLPQLFTSLVALTQESPLHSVKPMLHENEQALFTHAGFALARIIGQTLPHPLQLFGSLVGSTHVLPHRSGVFPEQLLHT